MQLILLAVLNTALALVLWIFGAYGLTAGIFASSASGLVMLSVLFVWGSVMGWKNKELSEKVREKRRVLRNKVFKKIFPINVIHQVQKIFLRIAPEFWIFRQQEQQRIFKQQVQQQVGVPVT